MKKQIDKNNYNNIEESHSFFGLFELNKNIWLLNSKIEDKGFIYMHRETYRPLLLLLNTSEINNNEGEAEDIKIVSNQLIFMLTTNELENKILQGTLNLYNEKEEEYKENINIINYYINHFIDKFKENGPLIIEREDDDEDTIIIKSNIVLNYYRKFLENTKLNLNFDFDLINRECKKRRT